MSKFKVSTREIGTVRVYDLEGQPSQDTMQDVVWKIQRNIRRYRIQRVILNLQLVPFMDPLSVRKLLAACIRPQISLIFGASRSVRDLLESGYLPKTMKVCEDECQITEDLGPFLIEKDEDKVFETDPRDDSTVSPGKDLDHRRAKRMHVALPIELRIQAGEKELIRTKAIATNVSDGGMFAEYLDLEAAKVIDNHNSLEGCAVDIHVFPNTNFPDEYDLKAKFIRKELRRKQLGVAIRFEG